MYLVSLIIYIINLVSLIIYIINRLASPLIILYIALSYVIAKIATLQIELLTLLK